MTAKVLPTGVVDRDDGAGRRRSGRSEKTKNKNHNAWSKVQRTLLFAFLER
jgi:hypothetical protein